MAKRQRHHQVAASFHYLIKTERDGRNPDILRDVPFRADEFDRIVARISDTRVLDETNDEVVLQIKLGNDLPFRHHELVEGHIHFGEFEGAYYGQEYRNNRLGVISADSLNLRRFNYLATLLRDGKILIGVTYNGQYGDYDGIRSCFTYRLNCGGAVASRTIRSISDELGNGEPVEVKLTYRKAAERPERRRLFGRSGVIAIKASEYGQDFGEEVAEMARAAKGSTGDRRRSIAQMVKESGMLELEDDDIIGCSALVRENGRTRTVYFLGQNSFSTKYPLAVEVSASGAPNREQVKSELVRVMRERVIPLIAG
ncbi:hypothetical protein AMC83_CH00370 [Rhizobium phaseoli]|uniref:hypothetical protein n=1 Tax=Rhizobium phaseoli TaxID=396 RepID=UPI0007EB215D|nr:hypothetical protein [Rhizobium phaseoli]ANL70408.1 hypothetical protein AMC83_CH00370 [Rhizobium phaseoli]